MAITSTVTTRHSGTYSQSIMHPAIVEHMKRLFAPRPTLDKLQWLKDHVYLDDTVSPPDPGPLNMSRTPWIEEMLRDYLDEHVEFMVLMMGSQTGKTLYILLCKCLQVHFAPAPALMVYPNTKLAERLVDRRLRPLIHCNPWLKEHVLPGKDSISKTCVRFDRMTLYLVGAASPTNISSDTIKYLDLDEIGKMKSLSRDEKDVLGNAIVRTKLLAGRGRKINIASTPNTKGGVIDTRYDKCISKRTWELKDPKTGEWFAATFDRMVFRGETRADWIANARLQTPSGALWNTDEVREAILAGRPTPRARDATEIGWWVPSWLSPYVSLEDVARRWWDAQGDVEEMKNVINNEAGMPYELTGDNIDERQYRACVGEYEIGQNPVPDDKTIAVATVDVQPHQGVCWVTWRLHSRRKSWLVWFGEVPINSMTYEGLSALGAFFEHKWGENVVSQVMFIDANGPAASMVYDYARAMPAGWVFPTFGGAGRSRSMRGPYTMTRIDKYPDGRIIPGGIVAYHWNVRALADELMAVVTAGKPWWQLPIGTTDEYFHQMIGEMRVRKVDKRGFVSHEWVMRAADKKNHLLDGERYQLGARHLLKTQLAGLDKRDPTPHVSRPTAKPAEPEAEEPAPSVPVRRKQRHRTFWQ